MCVVELDLFSLTINLFVRSGLVDDWKRNKGRSFFLLLRITSDGEIAEIDFLSERQSYISSIY